MICPSCANETPDNSRYCPSCGFALDLSNTPTISRVEPDSHAQLQSEEISATGGAAGGGQKNLAGVRPPSAKQGHTPSHSSNSGFEARYVPGTVLLERFRIVSPLGKGGMGEVYRAEDLKLGQTVALKFLPRSLGRNKEALERFTREVRLARQVSHPNVCRVFDIGEADGQTFLTMEFVDGEDLASLIRRIGRLPADKALEIARQACAGLAAAHEHGIIHRDLKPANIMLDGRGRARITDFGLAGLSAEMGGDEARAGTPAYMSPEQFAGREITPKSDLYSLGLVMYEVFTGKRPHDATTMDEMARLREKSTPTAPSQYLKDIDPLVERVILRCLEKDSTNRPASAMQVAAALPGGDPLAAALAAGETPSPEMVAASGTEGALAPWKAIAMLAGVIVLLVATVFLADRSQFTNLLPPGKSPEALRENAQNVLQGMGYTEKVEDSAYWIDVDASYWSYSSKLPSPDRYRRVAEEFPSPVHFVYRQSPKPLQAQYPYIVYFDNPPPKTPGDSTVTLDLQGKLSSFRITPPVMPVTSEDLSQSKSDAPDWRPLFAAAGLDLAQFNASPSDWYTQDPMDQKFAWEGEYSGNPIHVRGGSNRGRPVFFAVLGAWARPVELEYNESLGAAKLVSWVKLILIFGVLAVAFLLARRNIRLGRSDTKGVLRAAAFMFVVFALTIILRTHWSTSAAWEWDWLQIAIGLSAGLALQYSLFYLGAEPYFRRAWPELMISWSRLLAGELRSPLVGRDILTGVLFGAGLGVLTQVTRAVPYWFAVKSVTPDFLFGYSLWGLSPFLNQLFDSSLYAMMNSMGYFVLLFIFWKLARRKWIAALLMVMFGTLINLHSENPWGFLPITLLGAALVAICMMRVGVLALLFVFYTQDILNNMPLTSDLSRWFAPFSTMTLLTILVIAVYGFVVSLGSRKLFAGAFED